MKNDAETLELFCQRVHRLKRTRLAQTLRDPGLRVEIWQDADGDCEPIFPSIDEDDLDAFLLNYRLLTQKNERISVFRVAEILGELRLSVQLRAEFDSAREALNARLGSPTTIPIAGITTDREFIDSMLYGFFAHLDPTKYALAKVWEDIFTGDQLRLLFVTALEDVLQRLSVIETVVAKIRHELDPA